MRRKSFAAMMVWPLVFVLLIALWGSTVGAGEPEEELNPDLGTSETEEGSETEEPGPEPQGPEPEDPEPEQPEPEDPQPEEPEPEEAKPEDLEELDEDEDQEIQALPELLDDGAVIVYDYAGLVEALNDDNGIETIYLGEDITATEFPLVRIHAGKTADVIDGRPPDADDDHRASFTQYNINGLDRTLQVVSSSTALVTLRNLEIRGYNHYGVVGVASGIKDVTVRWENVDYEGSQPSYNPSGTEQYADSHFRIVSGNSGPEELAEASNLRFEGVVTVHSISPSHALLFTYLRGGEIRIAANATVSATAPNDFIYTDGKPPNLVLEPGASLFVNEDNGFTRGAQNLGDVLIDTGATLHINQNKGLAEGVLRVERSFKMLEDSSLLITRGPGTTGPAIGFPLAGGSAVFENPRHVALYTPSARTIRFLDRGSVEITTDSLNLWTQAEIPGIDGMADMPNHFWNRRSGETLTVTASYQSENLTGVTANLDDADPVQGPLNATTFQLLNTQLLTMGKMTLEPDAPLLDATALTGRADPGASLSASYPQAGGSQAQSHGAADVSGSYSLPVEGNLVAGETVSTIAGRDYLRMRRDVTVADAPGRLAFAALPESLAFQGATLAETPALVGREEADLRIAVLDTRSAKSSWRLEGYLSGPMEALVGGAAHQLPGALVFVDEQGNRRPLGPDPLPLHTDNAGGENTEILWGQDSGIMLWMPAGAAYSDAAYQAEIHWMLTDAP